jgi:hypothetical protein
VLFSPLLNAVHVAPPSGERKTPAFVPSHTNPGVTATSFTVEAVRPLVPAACQLAPPFVVR